jgi:hypothetical protein
MVAFMSDYRARVKTLSGAQADELAERVFELDSQRIRLNKKYYREMTRVLPSTRVFQFFQLMRRIDTLLNMRIASILPMIGENW